MADYGVHLGTAFQLVDDVLDYSGDHAAIGKNLGDDLAEGKPTLPLIYAMRTACAEQAALVRHAIEAGRTATNSSAVLEAIRARGALDYARAQAAGGSAHRACRARARCRDSSYREYLLQLADFRGDAQRTDVAATVRSVHVQRRYASVR